MAGQVVQTITIRGTEEGLSALTAKLRELAAEEKNVAVVSDDLSKRQISLAAAWKNTGLKLDENARAQDTYTKLIRQNDAAQKQNIISHEQHAQRVVELNEKYNQTTVGATKFAAGMTKAGDASAVASQRMISGMSGVSTAVTEAAKAPEAAISKMTAAMSKGSGANEVASQRMIVAMTGVGKASAGAAPEIEHVADQHANLAKQSALATKELSRMGATMLNLGRQFADVGVSLQMGQAITTVAVQQVPQIIDAVVSSGKSVGEVFGAAATWAGRFAMSLGGVATGVGLVGAAAGYSAIQWNESKVAATRSLMGIGQQSGATANQIEDIAKEASATTKITVGGAREMASALAQTGAIGVDMMKELVQHGHDFAKVLGVDITDAAKLMAESFADPAKGVKTLATRFSIPAKEIEKIQRLAAQLDFKGAQAALKDVIVPQLEKAGDATSAISKGWEGIKKFAASADENFNRNLDALLGMSSASEKLLQSQANLAKLEKQRDLPVVGPPVSLHGVSRDDSLEKQIKAAREEVTKLQVEAGKVTDENLVKLGQSAVNLAKQIAPSISQTQQLEDNLKGLNRVLSSPKTLEGMSANQVKQLTQARDLTADQLKYVNGIRAAYPDVSLQVGKQLDILTSQAAVAGARTQQEMLSAQYALDYKTAMAAGATATEATQIASKQQAVTMAAIARQENNLVGASKDQLAIAKEVTNEGRARAEAQATFNDLQRQRVSDPKAMEVAMNQYEASMTKITKQEKDMVQASQDQLNIAKESTLEGKARASAQATYNSLVAAGVSEQTASTVAANQYKASMQEIDRSAKNVIGSLSDQADVASAIGGQARVAAQAQATYNDMIRQGYSASQALAASEETRRAGLGAINAAMAEQLATLQDQGMVMAQSTGAGKIAASAQAATNKALREGATLQDAMAIGAQVYANGVAAANAAVEEQVHSLAQSTELINTRSASEYAAVKAAQAYENAIRSGADATHAAALEAATLANEMAKVAKAAQDAAVQQSHAATQRAGGDTSQAGPGGYTNFIRSPAGMTALALYGEGGFDIKPDPSGMFPTIVPNAQGLENMINKKFGGGAPGSGAIQPMLTGLHSSDTDVVQASGGILNRLIDLLPKEQQPDVIRSALSELQGAPTLAGKEMFQQLTEKLEELTKATEDNTSATSAMTDVLSPFYGTDPRATHLGFRAFAGGGIMTQYGELPLRHYQGGGMAASPQVAVFGEGSTPEAYVPVPAGRIPVEIKQPANSNQRVRPVNVNIFVQGNADQNTVAAMKSTAFQQAQAMRRAMS